MLADVIAFILFFAVVASLYRLFFHPLSKFPGPVEAKLWGIWRDRKFWAGSWHDDILLLHQKFGPVVRIAPNELSIVDETVARQLYGPGSRAVKSDWYGTWDDPAHGISFFATRDPEIHSFLRKRVSGAYSMSAILGYEEGMQSCLDTMMGKLHAYAEHGKSVDMSFWTNALAFDTVTMLAYGSPVGQLETGLDVMELQRTIHMLFKLVPNVAYIWGQSRTIQKLFKFLRVPNPMKEFENWTGNRVKQRRSTQTDRDRHDMLDHFVAMKSATGEPVGDQEVLTEALMLVGAGADTTASAMRACLFYLCTHPSVNEELRHEVDAAYKTLQSPITYREARKLPSLHAVIREAMRLLPSIVYPLYRHAPEAMTIAGFRIPTGTVVGVSPIAFNRNPAVWGDDANDFRPSRWLESEERSSHLNTNDLTFGGQGSRSCIGQNLALVEIYKFLAQLLHHFDFALVDPQKPWKVSSAFFMVQSDMQMRVTRRHQAD